MIFNSNKIKQLESRITQLENPFAFKIGDWVRSKENGMFGMVIGLKYDNDYISRKHEYTLWDYKSKCIIKTCGHDHLELISVKVVLVNPK